MRTAEEILRKNIGLIPFIAMDHKQGQCIINAIKEAQREVADEIKHTVVENRNMAHVNCLEETKQAFNLAINMVDNIKNQIK